MNPYQYQQQQLQYQQQYGQQQVQFVPYPYGVQQPMLGQYGGAYSAYQVQPNVAMGLVSGAVAQPQLNQGQQQALTTSTAFTVGQNQAVFTTPAYQYQAQPSTTTTSQSTTPVATSLMPAYPAMPAMAEIGQKYTEEYQKWQKEYTEWQAQHANHPDQKLFQEYQTQVQQWQQNQQQQLMTVQSGQVGVTPQTQPIADASTPQIGTATNVQTPQQALLQQPANPAFPLQPAVKLNQVKQEPNAQSQTQQNYQSPYNNYQEQNKPFRLANQVKQEPQKQLGNQQQAYHNRFIKAQDQNKPFGLPNEGQHNQQQQPYQGTYNKAQGSNIQFGASSNQGLQGQNRQGQQQTLYNKNQGGNSQFGASSTPSNQGQNRQGQQQTLYNKNQGGNNQFGASGSQGVQGQNRQGQQQTYKDVYNKNQGGNNQFGTSGSQGVQGQNRQGQQQTYKDLYNKNQGGNNQFGASSNQGIQGQNRQGQQQTYKDVYNKNQGGNNQFGASGSQGVQGQNRQGQQQTYKDVFNKNQEHNNQGQSRQGQQQDLSQKTLINSFNKNQQQNKQYGSSNQSIPNQWKQNTNNSSPINKKKEGQIEPYQYQPPKQGQHVLPKPTSANQGSQGGNMQAKQQPSWLNTKSNQQINNTPQAGNTTSPNKSIPKWMQSNENQCKQQNKTAPSAQKPLQSNESLGKPNEAATSNAGPKWMPSQAVTSSEEDSKLMPKWLKETRLSVQEQSKLQNQQTATQPPKPQEDKPIPKWLQVTNTTASKTSTSTTSTTPTTSSISSTSTTSSLMSNTTSNIPGFTPQKLDPKRELELLQKQSMQLQQLAELEKKQKESKAELKETPNQAQQDRGPSNNITSDTNSTTKETLPDLPPTPNHAVSEKPLLQTPEKVEHHDAKRINRPPAPQPSLLKKVPCRFFPNCRNGAGCKFKHPQCSSGVGCKDAECIYDHVATAGIPDEPPEGKVIHEPPPSKEPLGDNSRYGTAHDEWHPESRDDYRQWKEEGRDWQQQRDEWPGEPRERRPPSPREWDGRLRVGDEWDRERYQDWEEQRERPSDYRDDDAWDRWSSREPPLPRDDDRYEQDRWRRPPQEDWDYPEYRDRRPPSPRYSREEEYDRERRERPVYGRDEPPREPLPYDEYDRPPPPPDDRRRDLYDRDYDSRDPEWRDRRAPTDRYPEEDYMHPDRRGRTPPREEWRDYDRGERREGEPEMDRWSRQDRDHHYRDWEREPMSDRYQEPPRDMPPVEKKTAVVVPVESILDKPGRDTRPDRIVIILRGLPGSGKTHVARLIKDKEVSNGAHVPRIIGLDDYFLTEVEKHEKDPDTGKRVKKKVTEYVYEEEMEETYMASMFKVFTKTLEDGFFPVVMVDTINNKVEHFDKYWSLAKQKGFEVYIAELSADAHICAKRNSHQRSLGEIDKMLNEWEEIPTHMLRLDVRALLQDAIITEVEMETVEAPAAPKDNKPDEEANNEEEDEPIESGMQIHIPQKSKWEDIDSTAAEAQLNKLDGIRPLKRRRESSPIPSLSDDDDDDPYDEKEEDMRIGKKRVRWADLEDRKNMEHRRRIGFCIGTDWSILTDPYAKIPEH